MKSSMNCLICRSTSLCPALLWTTVILTWMLCLGQIPAAQAMQLSEEIPSDSFAEAQNVSPDNLKPWLQNIPLKTRRPGILPEETELYYQVLAYARDVEPQVLDEAARKFLKHRWENSKYKKLPFKQFPVYVDMYLHPEDYQGRPVTMKGHLQRSVVSEAGENEFGIQNLCEAWLFTDDSQANPTVVVVPQFPKGFPVGEQTVDHVTVTGYIYRMYTYEARDTGRYAPLLLAQRIDWTPPGERAQDYSWIWLVVGLFTLLFVGLVLGRFWADLAEKQRAERRRQTWPLEVVYAPDSRSEVKVPGTKPLEPPPENPAPPQE